MRIILAAPIEEPVPPAKYGGTELVVYNLCQEMVNRGHEVFLLASGDSQTSAQLIPLAPISLRKAYKAPEIDAYRNVYKIISIARCLKEVQNLQPDILFNHIGWRLAPFIQFINCPVYTTIHGPLDTVPERFTYEQYPLTSLISISDNQRLAMPQLNWEKTIYNGIDLNQFIAPSHNDRSYFAFLGRTSPEKGLKEICQMIKKTRHHLKIAAKVDSVDMPYFKKEVEPLIDGKQIEFIGEIGPDQKATFLQNAQGLLLWLNWEEPFGLVVVEAMASGTPVIVNRRGAMPELILDGQTGYLVNTLEEMKNSLDKVDLLRPENCRRHVLKHFSAQRMTSDYLALAG